MLDYEDGQIKEVSMHDGSTVILKKLEKDYDPRTVQKPCVFWKNRTRIAA